MLTVKQLAVLEGCSLFAGADGAIPQWYTDGLETMTYAAGEAITPVAGLASAGILLSGRAEAVGENGVVLNHFSAGDAFGVAALFGGSCYVSSVRAITACRAVFLPGEATEQLFRQRGDLAVGYIRFLSGRIRFLNARITAFTIPTAAEALSYWLERNASGGEAEVRDGWAALARSLNIGRASLYRARDELAAAGRISVSGKKITIMKEDNKNEEN